jgi:hypothetical protein
MSVTACCTNLLSECVRMYERVGHTKGMSISRASTMHSIRAATYVIEWSPVMTLSVASGAKLTCVTYIPGYVPRHPV